MKVKNLFLSMFAIAALASCSQNEDTPDNPVFGGQEAKVTLRLKGDAAPSRAVGVAPEAEAEKAIDNLSVFIFNKVTEGLVTKKHFANDKVNGGVVTVDTKTDGDKVVVIVNAANDEAAFNTLFGGVSSLATLRAVKMDLMESGSEAGQRTIKQISGKVLQNGWADVVYGTGDLSNTGSANVQMRFVGARIAVTSISWNGTNSGTFEANPTAFDTDGTKNFTIRAIYLMDANASTRLIPTLAGSTADSPANPADIGTETANNDYAPLGTRTFGCFEDITAAPWSQIGASQILSDDLGVKYVTANKPTVTPGMGNNAGEILNPAWWYVFGNETNATDGRATALVIKVGWLKGKQGEAYPGSDTVLNADEREDRYFTVYMDGLDKRVIQSGKSYSIGLKLNGNFLPASGTSGGTGGGGTTDPSTPSLDANVTVTVTTSTWRTVDFSKEWL